MTGSSLLSAGAALAFVLGLLVLAAHLLRRMAPRGSGGSGPGQIRVLARVGLAPRQGIATVQVEGRSVLVSYGEGGVRLLMELPEAESGEVGGTVDVTVKDPSREPRFQTALNRAAGKVTALRALVLGLVLMLSMPAAGSARQAAGPTLRQGPAAAAASVPTQSVAGAIPDVRVSMGNGDENSLELSGPVGTVLFVGFLTLLPTLLLLMTGFTRILIVLHLLKQALGTQTAPPAHLLAAMALMLTGFVMAPTFEQVNERALAPWMAGEMESGAMLKEASVPFRSFMLHSTREQDLAQFVEMSGAETPASVDEIPMVTLTAAFVTSELTSAFQMGFALFLPFLVIDVVVASTLMSMGMFMLPPVMVSLPFKLLLFVLVDGWSLVLGSLVRSFA